MPYQFLFSLRFRDDIREARKWYNRQQKGLGKKFYSEVKHSLEAIRKTPQFQIRYDEIRCLPLRKYPFMIHFTIDEQEKSVLVLACIHCSLEPHSHWVKENKG
jgi:hypothetical protein